MRPTFSPSLEMVACPWSVPWPMIQSIFSESPLASHVYRARPKLRRWLWKGSHFSTPRSLKCRRFREQRVITVGHFSRIFRSFSCWKRGPMWPWKRSGMICVFSRILFFFHVWPCDLKTLNLCWTYLWWTANITLFDLDELKITYIF